jgi:hypothetical protein
MREPLDDMGRGSALMPSHFQWGPLSLTQILGRQGRRGAPQEHMVAGLTAQVLRSDGPEISFLLLFR